MTEQEYAAALKKQAKIDGHHARLPQSYGGTVTPSLSDKIAVMLAVEPLNATELANLLGKSRAYVLETLRYMRKIGMIVEVDGKWRLTE